MQHIWKINGTQCMHKRWPFRVSEILTTMEIAKQTGVKWKLKVKKKMKTGVGTAHFNLGGE